MYPSNAFVIRLANGDDQRHLRRLQELDGVRFPEGPTLVGEIDGTPAAAISLADGRVAADPFQSTAVLVQLLQMRSRALRTYSETPSLIERLRSAFAPFRARTAAAER
jgi:hypothetical protein